MRQLHPTGSKERMIAYGTYHYTGRLFDQLGPIIEDWSLYRLPDATVMLRADRHSEHGFELLEALCNAPADGGAILRFDVGSYPKPGAWVEKRGSFMLEDTVLTISTQVKGTALQTRLEIFDPAPYTLVPDAVVARGWLGRFPPPSAASAGVVGFHHSSLAFSSFRMITSLGISPVSRPYLFSKPYGQISAEYVTLHLGPFSAHYHVDARGVVISGEDLRAGENHGTPVKLTGYVQGM